jgi:hypothetical protein
VVVVVVNVVVDGVVSFSVFVPEQQPVFGGNVGLLSTFESELVLC